MLGNKLINTNAGGGCTNTVDLYNPFPDGGGLALYQLNGNATDVSGNYNGTATNVTYGAGEFGQAGVFNGSSSKITIPNGGIISSSGGFAISFWLKWNGDADYAYLFQFGNQGGQSFYTILHDAIDTLYWGVTNSGYGSSISVGYSVAERSVWTNFVISWDGTTNVNAAKIYKNGALAIEGTQTKSQPNIGNQEYLIGNNGAEWFNGELDQLRFFNRALRPYEVEALYTEEYCTPTIVPSEHFNTVLYSGNSGTQSITSVGFAPDFTWIKERTGTDHHRLQDTVRGAGYRLYSSTTSAEGYTNDSITSFDANGFSLGSSLGVNESGQDYVAWNFKAGGDAIENTDGTITSQVSANTEAGFSVVSYTGSGANATIGHGLSVNPSMIIVKGRNTAYDWVVYNSNLGATQYIVLNKTDQALSASSVWNDTEPTNSVFSVGSNLATNQSADPKIAYCFAEVEGFSSFGSYVGTGASGNSIVTGFEPAFVMIKRTDAIGNWFMLDNKRDNTNPNNLFLLANAADNEKDLQTTDALDFVNFLENGFEVLNGGAFCNASGGSYIYMAFAADPTAVEPTLEDSFNTVLYTGNRGTKEVTGIGFQPDFVWIKNRNAIASNFLHDTVRGKNNNYYESLISNGTFAESTTNQAWHDSYGWISDIYDGGFTVNQGSVIDDPSYNNTQDYVAWAWKGAEIPAINSNGSIPSVVSANPAAGFSIVSWTGNASTATIGHGLGLAPKMIITKARNVAGTRWNTFHASVGTGKYLSLETANAASTFALAWPTLPDEDVWYMSSWENYTGENYISYVFAEVAGFSKFGSYSGTGASGNTVTVGFEPAFVMIKRTDVAGNGWLIADNKRDTTNPIELFLSPNTSQAEFPITNGIDFNVTDFTIDSTNGSLNASGGTYIYMAFANQF